MQCNKNKYVRRSVILIRTNKLGDVGFSRNLIGLPSMVNGHTMFTSREIDNLRSETMAGVNSRFAVVTEN